MSNDDRVPLDALLGHFGVRGQFETSDGKPLTDDRGPVDRVMRYFVGEGPSYEFSDDDLMKVVLLAEDAARARAEVERWKRSAQVTSDQVISLLASPVWGERNALLKRTEAAEATVERVRALSDAWLAYNPDDAWAQRLGDALGGPARADR